jgi:membrane protease YdiL (CAAX protease family)
MEDLAALIQALLVIFFVGGLALLAQWGRKNRGARLGLIFTLLFVSLLAMALGTLVGWLEVISSTDLPPEFSASSAIVIVFAGLAGLALCVPPLKAVTGSPHRTMDYDAVNLGRETFADRFSGGWWSDPPVFLALWMFVFVLAGNVVTFLAFTLTPDVVDSVLASAGRLSPASLALDQVPFVVIALLGVGLGVRRNPRETLTRLGFGSVSPPQLGIVALFVVGALMLQGVFSILFAILQPDLFKQVGEISERLFSPAGLSPISAILLALLIGVSAGLGEEILFRGAIQPALGITLTSVLFTSMHVQYGPSILLGYLFIVSVGLGLLRKRINTTASFLAHTIYNSLGVLLTYFLGV